MPDATPSARPQTVSEAIPGSRPALRATGLEPAPATDSPHAPLPDQEGRQVHGTACTLVLQKAVRVKVQVQPAPSGALGRAAPVSLPPLPDDFAVFRGYSQASHKSSRFVHGDLACLNLNRSDRAKQLTWQRARTTGLQLHCLEVRA